MENLHHTSPDTSGIPELEVRTEREMLAYATARYLVDVLGIGATMHETIVFAQGGNPARITYTIKARTTANLFDEAKGAAVTEVFAFDMELQRMGIKC